MEGFLFTWQLKKLIEADYLSFCINDVYMSSADVTKTQMLSALHPTCTTLYTLVAWVMLDFVPKLE